MFANLTGKRLLAIDWDTLSLRVVQFRAQKEKVEILKALSVPMPAEIRQDDAESLGAFLRQALLQAGIRDKRAALTIPREKVVLNTLTVPPTPLDELPALVQFQIVKELPFAADQATLDFAVRGSYDAKAPTEVLVAAVRNEAMTFYTQVAREAGLDLQRVGLRPHANLVAFSAGAEIAKSGLCLAIDIGPSLTEINVIRDGGLVFSRSASVRLPSAAEMGVSTDTLIDSRIVGHAVPNMDATTEVFRDAVGTLMVEITRSIEAYRATEPGAKLDQIIVAGATGVESTLAETLHQRLGAHAELYNPGLALDLPPQRARELRGFSAAIGLAMEFHSVGPGHFNFLSPKKAVTAREKRMRPARPVALAVVMVLLGTVLYRQFVVTPKENEVDALKKSIAALKIEVNGPSGGKVDGVEGLRKRVAAVQNWFDAQHVWTSRLIHVTHAFPPDKDAYATAIAFADSPPVIEVQMQTKRSDVSKQFVDALKKEGYTASTGAQSESANKLGYPYADSVKIFLTAESGPRPETPAATSGPAVAATTRPAAGGRR